MSGSEAKAGATEDPTRSFSGGRRPVLSQRYLIIFCSFLLEGLAFASFRVQLSSVLPVISIFKNGFSSLELSIIVFCYEKVFKTSVPQPYSGVLEAEVFEGVMGQPLFKDVFQADEYHVAFL